MGGAKSVRPPVPSPTHRARKRSHSRMDGSSSPERDAGKREAGASADIEVKREKNRIKQRNLRGYFSAKGKELTSLERRANRLIELEATILDLEAVHADLESRLAAALARANDCTAWAQQLERALITHGYADEADSYRRAWGMGGAAGASMAPMTLGMSQSPHVPGAGGSDDRVGGSRASHTASFSQSPHVASSYLPPMYGASGTTSAATPGVAPHVAPSLAPTDYSAGAASNELWSKSPADKRGSWPSEASFDAAERAVPSTSAAVPPPTPAWDGYINEAPAISSQALDLVSMRSPSRLSIEQLLSPMPSELPMTLTPGAPLYDHWAWPVPGADPPSMPILTGTPDGGAMVAFDNAPRPRASTLDMVAPTTTVEDRRYSDLSAVDDVLAPPDVRLSNGFVIGPRQLHRLMPRADAAAVITLSHHDPAAAYVQAARLVLRARLGLRGTDQVAPAAVHVPPVTDALEQHVVLLGLVHLCPPDARDRWQARQLDALAPPDAKMLFQYHTSRFADPRVCLMPIAILRAAIVQRLRDNLVFDMTAFLDWTLRCATIFGSPLDPDAWELPDEYWDEWQGPFPAGRAYCESISAWRRRDGHTGSNVAQMLLGVEEPMARRADAVRKPPGWKFSPP